MAKYDPWSGCIDTAPVTALSGNGWRVCGEEQQRASATLVDSLAEQQQLEAMLAAQSLNIDKRLDPRLNAPWAKRSLLGSRFTAATDQSFFYGALELDTAIAEAAHRRWQFWQGMVTPPPSGRIRGCHHAFSFAYHCPKGLRLQQRPFNRHYAELIQTDNYRPTQTLGALLQARGIGGFEAPSARCPQIGINLVLTDPSGFTASRVSDVQFWMSEIGQHQVVFSNGRRLLRFSIETLRQGIG